MGDLGAVRVAELVAPIVDRVTIAVHRASREQGRELLTRFGLPGAGLLIGLRLALPTRPVPHARAVARYLPEADFRAELSGQAERGMLVLSDGALDVTDRGRELYREMFALHDRIASALWQGRAGALPRLADLTGRMVAAGLAEPGPAFAATAPAYEPADATRALVLFNRLTSLRQHRADAHAAAWSEAGLSVEQIQALDAGPLREQIEARTNELAAPPYTALADSERLEFLAGLGALPN